MEISSSTTVQDDLEGSDLWDQAKATLSLGAKYTGIVAAEALSHRWISKVAAANGLCIENILPVRANLPTKQLVNWLIAPVKFLRDIGGLNPQQVATTIAPIVEEVQFRYLFQQVILKQAPKTVLKKLLPNHTIDFDALPIKVLRALATAALFAVAHVQYHSCDAGGGASVFLGGLLYSALIESGDSIITTSCLHMLWNQMSSLGF